MIPGLGTWFSSKQPEEAVEGEKQKLIIPFCRMGRKSCASRKGSLDNTLLSFPTAVIS